MDKKDIVVVIPVYRAVLTHKEEISLKQCVDILAEYSLTIIKPGNLDISIILSCYPMLKVESFSGHCFSSLRAYNKLMLDEEFYKRFSCYQYMLIYQLDAYVFRDELLIWANKGYDYIGAPWLPLQPGKYIQKSKVMAIKRFFYQLVNSPKVRKWKYYEYEVGNGGFSLRKITKMIKITHRYKNRIASLLDDDKPFFPEDVLLFLEIRKAKFRLNTPAFNEALKFSMEVGSWWAYEYNNRELPFGCHAWYHKEYYPFWKTIINY